MVIVMSTAAKRKKFKLARTNANSDTCFCYLLTLGSISAEKEKSMSSPGDLGHMCTSGRGLPKIRITLLIQTDRPIALAVFQDGRIRHIEVPPALRT
jgi:hypothetical protein